MPRKPAKPEDPWSDRFQNPTPDALEGAVQEPVRDLFVHARTRLDSVEDASCEIKWLGVPWRWSFIYAIKGDNEPLAYLVPDPVRPQISVPMDVDTLERIAPKRLSRTIKDGIVFAAQVGARRWATWDLQSENQIDEILTLVVAKLDAGAATA